MIKVFAANRVCSSDMMLSESLKEVCTPDLNNVCGRGFAQKVAFRPYRKAEGRFLQQLSDFLGKASM